MRTLRSYFQEIEFAEVTFHYRLETARILPAFPELSLRSPLHRAGIESLDPEAFERLFSPPLPADPTALRRYQRPAPPFAFQPSPGSHQKMETAIITCHLFGDGITSLDLLIKTMAEIQPFLFANRQCDGHLTTVTAADASGSTMTIWQEGMNRCSDPPRITAAWRFDSLPLPATNDWHLKIITPARLLVQKKPLFRPKIRHILPFVLRRVTAMCYFCNHLEIEGAAELLSMNTGIEEEWSDWHWDDWRSHLEDGMLTGLGGVCGDLHIKGQLSDDLVALLFLGSLMNIGKGAAYGAGAYRFTPSALP